MTDKKVLIVGASGLVGYAALKYFSKENCEVIVVSRRKPLDTYGSQFISVDLMDKNQCDKFFSTMNDVTHIVYTALYEKPNLIDGWVDEEQIKTNDQMLRNMFEPFEKAAKNLKHVTLLQGAKAYGVHVKSIQNPAREGISEMREQPNFYWLQEDYLKEKQVGKDWSWTIFRPALIVGESIGSAMNIIPVLGVYATILKERNKPLYFPGGVETIRVATDADLLASAISWAGEANTAYNEIFNITNGDVFVWSTIWKNIAETLRMQPGENIPFSLKAELPKYVDEWDKIREKYDLISPSLFEFVGYSLEYGDRFFAYGHKEMQYPNLYSDIKLRQAGFTEYIDSEHMFINWLKLYQDKGFLPRP
ncbi:NAD-dependent epimerase/dehydratase family protein [Oceanobacillus sp. CF4.6]|uniref:NAD-dependent epimerase/dehydratase family protein n=1 Tax=Oceanobacillus sp. CF4.6 TaxID=3373080 RepID=UPI003EE7475E